MDFSRLAKKVSNAVVPLCHQTHRGFSTVLMTEVRICRFGFTIEHRRVFKRSLGKAGFFFWRRNRNLYNDSLGQVDVVACQCMLRLMFRFLDGYQDVLERV